MKLSRILQVKNEGATAKQLTVYNALAKKYNAQPKAQRVIPANDLKQLETIYRLMSDNEKNESLPFPECNLTSNQEEPIMWILINRKDELLVDDELGTLESINNKLKKLAKEGKSGSLVSIKYDPETSKEIISKVEALVKANKFKVLSFDISPVMVILINRNDELLVDDELGNLESIDNKLKKLAKEGESGRVVSIKYDPETSKEIISKVEALVKANKFKVVSFDVSKIPPPPPPPAPKNAGGKSGPIEINGATYYFIQENGKTTYFDRYGKIVDINRIPPPPPIPMEASPKQKAKMQKAQEAYNNARQEKGETNKDQITGFTEINGEKLYYISKNGETTYFNRYGNIVKMDNLPPPPPAPETTSDFVIRMAKANAKFFNEGKSISSDEAIALIKKNDKLNINAQTTDKEQPLIYISKKPIVIGVNGKVGEHISKNQEIILPIINGKIIKTGKLTMTLNEIKKLKLSLANGEITNFKFKIPGVKTQLLKGNTITSETIKNLNTAKTGDIIMVFDIKDNNDSKISPVGIEIID